jgi:hypothetical protein
MRMEKLSVQDIVLILEKIRAGKCQEWKDVIDSSPT